MDGFLRDLMSGRSHGALPAVLRTALEIATVGYGCAVAWRNQRYDRGVGVHRAAVPVVSVGNLTAGGTGKTPVVGLIANHFRRRGVNVAILSRGYKSLAEASHGGPAGNDEARVLDRLCPGILHLQRPDRAAAAAAAVSNGAELLVLDDGFQHRRLARDLDLVLIDATNPFGFDRMLPRGLLREPVESLRRADLILLTRADAVSREQKRLIVEAIRGIASVPPVVEVSFPVTGLVSASGERIPAELLAETPLLAFCGIGNPNGFAATLIAGGLRATEFVPFPDHHHYGLADLRRIAQRAASCGAGAAVTTLKDLVKIRSDTLPEPSGLPLWAVEIGCEVGANAQALFDWLDGLLGRATWGKAA